MPWQTPYLYRTSINLKGKEGWVCIVVDSDGLRLSYKECTPGGASVWSAARTGK